MDKSKKRIPPKKEVEEWRIKVAVAIVGSGGVYWLIEK